MESVEFSSRANRVADRISLWFSRHWLAVVNIALAVYIGVPICAPVLEKTGHPAPAQFIYKAYRLLCHELPQRSFFLFGEKPQYSLQELADRVGAENLPGYPWPSSFDGNEQIGYKAALCQRDLAIYGSLLLSGLIFGLVRTRVKPIPFWAYVLIGIIPIGLDGGSQLISYMVQIIYPSFVPRESTWLLRVITGTLFGSATAWLAFPMLHTAFAEVGETSKARLEQP